MSATTLTAECVCGDSTEVVGTDESARNSIAGWKQTHVHHVRATRTVTPPSEGGEHTVDGIRFKISPRGSQVWFRSDCARCVEYEGHGAPGHDAMPGCRSGGTNHCSCDGCF